MNVKNKIGSSISSILDTFGIIRVYNTYAEINVSGVECVLVCLNFNTVLCSKYLSATWHPNTL